MSLACRKAELLGHEVRVPERNAVVARGYRAVAEGDTLVTASKTRLTQADGLAASSAVALAHDDDVGRCRRAVDAQLRGGGTWVHRSVNGDDDVVGDLGRAVVRGNRVSVGERDVRNQRCTVGRRVVLVERHPAALDGIADEAVALGVLHPVLRHTCHRVPAREACACHDAEVPGAKAQVLRAVGHQEGGRSDVRRLDCARVEHSPARELP